jgi:ferritin-like protein
MASDSYHEPIDVLTESSRDLHRALRSLMEELEAVDWYQQRVAATGDAELAAILGHNRDEEIEHAVMTLEWLRRKSPVFDAQLRTYLFTQGPVTEVEASTKMLGDGGPSAEARQSSDESGSLAIGSLKNGAR